MNSKYIKHLFPQSVISVGTFWNNQNTFKLFRKT